MEGLPELDRPPTYTSCDVQHPAVNVNHEADPKVTFDSMSPLHGHIYEVYNTGAGLDVTDGERQLFYISRHSQIDMPDLIVHGGYDCHGPQLALVDISSRDHNIRIYLGGLRNPSLPDWDIVRCASDGKLFHSSCYRFDITSSLHGLLSKRRLYWQKTHDSKLGASKLSQKDFKLVDEADDTLLAVYTEHHLGTPGKLKGKINFRTKLDDHTEVAALTTLMGIMEKARRVNAQRVRAWSTSHFK